MTGPKSAGGRDEVRAIAGLSLVALAVGLLAGLGAATFVAVQHHLTHLLWHTVPEALGLVTLPWYVTVGLPVLGGGLVWVASQLPGHGGHGPLEGLRLDLTLVELPSVLLAALASLCFGAVLGPEAPLLAIGTAAGVAVVRSPEHPARQVMMIVGAMAAFGAVLGNPLVTTVLMLEVAIVSGAQLTRPTVLVPALVGLGGGYLLQVGVGPWTGLGRTQLSVPGLASYQSVRLTDLLAGLVLAVLVAAIAVAAMEAAEGLHRRSGRAPLAFLLSAGVITGGAAAVASAATGQSPDMVLFAGQTAMADYLALPSVVVAAVLLVSKFVAYVVCLGSGFRGGALFPAIALGAILAGVGGLAMGSEGVPALAATAIAAATAGAMRMPFTAVLLAVLLTIAAGSAVTVPAILGAVVGMLVRLTADHLLAGRRAVAQPT